MATYSSSQHANYTSVPATLVKPNELGGRRRTAWFSVTTSAYASTGDTINLTTLPKGARVIAGHIAWAANAASTTISIGYTGAATRFLGATAVGASAGTANFANTVALNFGEELTAITVIVATPGGATWTAGTSILGYVDYVID
jgi:hypothetical protein